MWGQVMPLPNFLIIGAKKAATTSLHNYLKQHPDIFMSRIKEPRYFAFDPENSEHVSKVPQTYPITTLDQYSQLFDKVSTEKAIGESSPNYLRSKFAANKIKHTLHAPKLIVCLRNPVDRAYSNYIMNVRECVESRLILEAFNESESWVQGGLYYDDVKRYIDLFGRDSIKIVLFEELVRKPTNVVKDIFRFLNVDENFVPDMSVKYNLGGMPKNKLLDSIYQVYKRNRKLKLLVRPYLPNKLRSAWVKQKNRNINRPPSLTGAVAIPMQRFYEDDVLKLQDLVGINLAVWSKYNDC